MAPHLTDSELDWAFAEQRKFKTIPQIHEALSQRRAKKDIATPDITTVRRALRGATHRRGRKETRGRKKVLSSAMVRKMNTARKTLSKKAAGKGAPVRWADIIKTARVPTVSRTTALKSFRSKGIKIALRNAREKPQRSTEHEQERVRICETIKRHSQSFWLNSVDLFMENKRFDIPTSRKSREHVLKQRVPAHLRTPGEGLQPEFTKPALKKHKINTGGSVSICAGICGGKVTLWEELPKRWCGEAAANLYKGPIRKLLKKRCPEKSKYLILEDNDPAGYKSGKAMKAKRDLHIKALAFPKYSPDLNPLDFAIWSEVGRRMQATTPKRVESIKAYKARLRKTALGLPKSYIRKVLSSMPRRVRQVIKAKGKSISRD